MSTSETTSTQQPGEDFTKTWGYKLGLGMIIIGHVILLTGLVLPALGLAGGGLVGTLVVGGEDKDAVWKRLQDIISENYPWLAANLTKCRLKKLTERSLEIVVEGNGFNVNVIKRNKSRAIIQKVCEDFFGKKMDLIIHAQESRDTGNQKKKNSAFQLKQEAINHPLVADAIEMFNGTVVDVKLL